MIRAVVRVRPPRVVESEEGAEPSKVQILAKESGAEEEGDDLQVVTGTKQAQRMRFSKCFGKETTQDQFFHESGASHLVQHALDGYSATVFSYGQTGAGKTFTVFGNDGTTGCFGQSMKLLFEKVKEGECSNCSIKISSIEIYNEKVLDLLVQLNNRDGGISSNSRRAEREPLQLGWSTREKGFIVKGATFIDCNDLETALDLLKLTMTTRKVGAHKLNARSNRSHCITFVYICNQSQGTFGKLTFCDLAGSERLKQTESCDPKVSGYINKSLFTLSKVIRSLDSKQLKPPFRDSALTKLLCSSLGGTSMALLIACISDLDQDIGETIRTLRFASRTMRIENHPVVHRSKHEQLVFELRTKIRFLEEQNARLSKALEERDARQTEQDVCGDVIATTTVNHQLDNHQANKAEHDKEGGDRPRDEKGEDEKMQAYLQDYLRNYLRQKRSDSTPSSHVSFPVSPTKSSQVRLNSQSPDVSEQVFRIPMVSSEGYPNQRKEQIEISTSKYFSNLTDVSELGSISDDERDNNTCLRSRSGDSEKRNNKDSDETDRSEPPEQKGRKGTPRRAVFTEEFGWSLPETPEKRSLVRMPMPTPPTDIRRANEYPQSLAHRPFRFKSKPKGFGKRKLRKSKMGSMQQASEEREKSQMKVVLSSWLSNHRNRNNNSFAF